MKISNFKSAVKFTLFFLAVSNCLLANSRVAYSRPSTFIRTPSDVINYDVNKFNIGFATEVINVKDFLSTNAFFFKSTSTMGHEIGVSFSRHAQKTETDTNPPTELSFHLNKEIFQNNNFIINIGIQDVLYQTEKENQISLFMTLINKNIKIGSRYKMQSAVGFGSGKINNDTYDYDATNQHETNIFFGFKFDTPILKKYSQKGMQFLFDYDGSGFNFGSQIFITEKTTLNFGVTHLENIGSFNEYKDGNKTLYLDAPSLSFGVDFQIPTKKSEIKKQNNEKFSLHNYDTNNECYLNVSEKKYETPLSVNLECEDQALLSLVHNINTKFITVYDSLIFSTQNLKAEQITNQSLINKTKTLEDSLNIQYLNQHISQSEINIGMKFLSKSLKYYYSGDYYLALEQVDMAQKYLPNLAYSYAREGSIYFKIGDLKRAGINWNIALTLDPEYDEVREMLSNLKIETQESPENLTN